MVRENTTLISGSWVVGHDGETHIIIRDGACVFRGNTITYVGGDYAGPTPDIRLDYPGMLVSPGLISTHMHANFDAVDYVFLDRGRRESFGGNYLNWQAPVRDSSRYRPDPLSTALFGLGQTLRSGVTTAVEIGALGDSSVMAEAVESLGMRVYTAPSHRNVVTFSRSDGSLEADWDEKRGWDGLASAIEFFDLYDGTVEGRLRGILCPGHPNTCTPELLEATASLAAEHAWPVTIHASINIPEVMWVLERYRLTPIELLERCGLLGANVILGHAVFLGHHSAIMLPGNQDIELLAKTQTSISHSPLKYAFMGYYMESLQSLTNAGVNVAMGTDFPPNDIVREMRCGMLMSRVADRDFLSGAPRQVFDAATINGAHALGRDDIGALKVGARADIAVFDLNQLHFGAAHDPIRSLVERGSSKDVYAVFVDGRQLADAGKLLTVDEDTLISNAQVEGELMWADVPNWSWEGRDIDDMISLSYPIL